MDSKTNLDPQAILETMFGDAIDDGQPLTVVDMRDGQLSWSRFADVETAVDHAMGMDACGHDTYFSLGLVEGDPAGRGKADDVKVIGTLWADIDIAGDAHSNANLPADVDEALALVDAMPLKPSVIINSGHGLHVYWFFTEPWEFEDEAERQQAASLAHRWHGLLCDLGRERDWKLENCGDLSRILRVPGTLNHKNPADCKPVIAIHADLSMRYDIDHFENVLPDEQQENQSEIEIDSLALKPEASPPVELFAEAMDRSHKFKATWDYERSDLDDESTSGYDMALATMAAMWDWSDQHIADLIIAFRRKHNREPAKALRRSYISKTIERARQASAEMPRESDDVDLTRFTIRSKENPDWPEPIPISTERLPVPPFDPAWLPETIRPWIQDISERMQCPIEFPAVAGMIALAGVTGRKVGICPKRYDNWLVIPNLWGAIIGRPSAMKSPPLREVFRPVRALIDSANREHLERDLAFSAEQAEVKLRASVLESQIKSALRKGEPVDELSESLAKIVQEASATDPARKRYIVNDSTAEALEGILANNPNGLIVMRDELSGFLRSLDKDGQEAARAFYLESWDGHNRHESDRVGRGNTQIHASCLSIIGTIQPGPLLMYLNQAMTGGKGDDGLMQRFQLAVWPDDSKTWQIVDRRPDDEAQQRAFAVFDRIDTLIPEEIGATKDSLRFDDVAILRFSEPAQDCFYEWLTEHNNRLRQDRDYPAIESHLAKYPSLVPSIALLIHLAESGMGNVPVSAVERAVHWARYLEQHACRIYGCGLEPDVAVGRALAEKLHQHKVNDSFSLRDIYRRQWARLANKEEASRAVDYLVEMDWLRRETLRTKGAPKTIHRINPRIYEKEFKELAA